MDKKTLFGKTLTELTALTAECGLPKFAAKQIADWLYKKEIVTIEQMSNLSKAHRELLSERYTLGLEEPINEQKSVDGTKKYLFPAGPNMFIESAYIPEDDRATLCVSSQVGCKMGCLFCMTGKQGFQKNLTAGQIANQIRSLPERSTLSNIVYMGMGEPFDNINEVLKSTEILTSDWGFAMSPRRITVSSIGIVPAMIQFIEQSQCHLAISLHSPFDAERQSLMPIQHVYPIEKVIEIIRKYDWKHQRRVSFEYIVFDGVNDSMEHVRGLTKLLNGLACRINLIRFHAIPGSPLKGASNDKMIRFRDALTDKGLFSTVRQSRGEDILAACGMLSTKEKQKKSDES